MLAVSSVAPAKYKRRKVSAVRDFPKGCGCLTLVVNGELSKESPASAAADPIKFPKSEEAPGVNGTSVLPREKESSADPSESAEPVSLLVSVKPVELLEAKEQVGLVDSSKALGTETEEENGEDKGSVKGTKNLKRKSLEDSDSLKPKDVESVEAKVHVGLVDSSKALGPETKEEEKGSVEGTKNLKRKHLEGSDSLKPKDVEYLEANSSKTPGPKGKVEKGEDKGSMKGTKNLKRKSLENSDTKGRVANQLPQRDEPLEADGDRLIVQALMAAQNCPWRQGYTRVSKPMPARSVSPSKPTKPKDVESKSLSLSQPRKPKDVESSKGFSNQVVKFGSLEIVKENLDQPVLLGASKTNEAEKEKCLPKTDLPKRKISAFRDFPFGCGPNAPRLSREDRLEAIASSKRKGSDEMKQAEGSVRVASTEKVEGEVNGNNAKQAITSSKRKGSDEMKQAEGSSVRVASTEKVEDEVNGNNAKQGREEVQKISRVPQPQPKYVSKSNSIVKVVGESREKKDHESKELNKNLQIREAREKSKPPPLDARPQSVSKLVERGARSPAGKSVVKGSANNQMGTKNLKRKLSEEPDNKRGITNSPPQEDESLEAYGNKVIVQALMAAPNCPWRPGRRSSSASKQRKQ